MDIVGRSRLPPVEHQLLRNLLQRLAHQQGAGGVVHLPPCQTAHLPENGLRQAGEAEHPDASGQPGPQRFQQGALAFKGKLLGHQQHEGGSVLLPRQVRQFLEHPPGLSRAGSSQKQLQHDYPSLR